MPKDRRMRSSYLSCDQSRAFPYACSLGNVEPNKPEKSVEGVEQWEDIRCPICMEPPHNALLLRCSSFEQGCRPYICDTSCRHTNCFDQFAKTRLLDAGCEETLRVRTVLRPEDILVGGACPIFGSRKARQLMIRDELVDEDEKQQKFLCPLCRGEIYEVIKVKDVREFLNEKVRNCSNEKCNFSGTYFELRNHARTEHPDVQPAEADPERLREWERMEREEYERELQTTVVNPSVEDLVGDYVAYAELFDCLLSVAYYTRECGLGPWVNSLGELPLRNNSRRRVRPNLSSAVDRRFHGRNGVGRRFPSPSGTDRGLQRHGAASRGRNTSRGERRFHGYGGNRLDGFNNRRRDF